MTMLDRKRYIRWTGIGLLLLATACKQKELPDKSADKAKQAADTIQTPVDPPEKLPEIKYHAYPLKGVDTAVKAFRARYSEEEQWLILALNRLDAGHIRRADTLIIPDTLLPELLDYSPFPRQMPMLEAVNKMVVFSYPIQAFAAYEKGKQVFWGPTSMGSKVHPTPTGLHFANWKARETISTVNDEWKLKWNFNIANKEGVGWHQYAMPGYPASHSCLRLLESQAKWLYGWAEQWIVRSDVVKAQGTPVLVYGAYPFGNRRPWLNLIEDPKANEVSREALEQEIQPYLKRILEQQERRDTVLAPRQDTLPAAS